MAASYRFVVTGQVQGVFFRQSTVERARALSVAGWVRNREDGAVEGIASGAPEALAQFRAWLARGPATARVDDVEWSGGADEPVGGSFIIRA
jgi:acylphosphatase